MLGRNLFKVESEVELSNERFKSLVIFYVPLIGSDALALYEFLLVKGNSFGFDEISKILNSLNISVDNFEANITKLNQYKLVRTLKDKEDKYIFILKNPLTLEEFIKNDILVREFILKTSGEYYQSLISNYRSRDKHLDFEDVSSKLSVDVLANWSPDNEKYLNVVDRSPKEYDFNTLFDINLFLSDISNNLLPLKFRSEDNLKKIAELADLYNVSPDKMRTFLPKVAKTGSDSFDLSLLEYLCESSVSDYKVIKPGSYNVPCVLFLMNKQDGKEVSKYDKKMLYRLSNDYHLKAEVINVLIEHALKTCDNHLYEKFLYPVASDWNRNDIDSAEKALKYLTVPPKRSNNKINKQETKPVYDNNDNPEYDERLYNDIMNRRDK